jgi:hypothetical protein
MKLDVQRGSEPLCVVATSISAIKPEAERSCQLIVKLRVQPPLRAHAEANESPAKIEERAHAQIAALVRYLRTI